MSTHSLLLALFVVANGCQAAPVATSQPECGTSPGGAGYIQCPPWPVPCPPCCPMPTMPGEEGRCLGGSCQCVNQQASTTNPTIAFQVTVQNQTFLVNTSGPALIAEARQQIHFVPAVQRQHVIGSVVEGSNTGWSWHLVNWTFFGMSSEACDGTPAIVEQNVQNWIQTHRNAAFCPWSSYVSTCASANCADLPPVKPQNAEYLVTLEMNSTQPDRKAVVSLITNSGGRLIRQFVNGTILDVDMPMSLVIKVQNAAGVEAV